MTTTITPKRETANERQLRHEAEERFRRHEREEEQLETIREQEYGRSRGWRSLSLLDVYHLLTSARRRRPKRRG